MLAEFRGGCVLKTAAGFLHECLCGAVKTDELQVLPDESNNVAICLVELYAFDGLQVVVVIVCVMCDTVGGAIG